MTAMKIVEPRLKWFVGKMRKKLAMPKNVAKTDWRNLTMRENLDAILQEYRELLKEWTNYRDKATLLDIHADGIIYECADIANRAMMLADQVNAAANRERAPR